MESHSSPLGDLIRYALKTVRTQKFQLQIGELLFSDDADSLSVVATLFVGDRHYSWGGMTSPICALRLISFLRETLSSFSWQNPYASHDLSTNGPRLSIDWKSTNEIGAVYCLVKLDAEDEPIVSVWPGDINASFSNLAFEIVKQSCHSYPHSTTAKWARLLHGPPPPTAEFEIGERVETVIGPNVKTERTGWIYSSCTHHKKQCTEYKLLVGDSVHKKRYYANDLQRVK
jgi:hypothetical protein